MPDLCQLILQDFIKNSWQCIQAITDRLKSYKKEKNNRKSISMFRFESDKKIRKTFEGNNFFLRGSVEYSNPQLTLEEIQGIVGARMLETCGNYFFDHELHKPEFNDVNEICEKLKAPSKGPIVAFLLNTDDIEADRYSMNPLRESILKSGQSAFPVAYVTTEKLKIDDQFVAKYKGNLICNQEVETIKRKLDKFERPYVDFVDSVKYAQLKKLSEKIGIDLALHSLRMPIATLKTETKKDTLHYIISQIHRDYESISLAYNCMKRSMAKRKTLLTVPHSQRGFGSKRAARGKLHFEGNKLEKVNVNYRTTLLYPNEIDREDISVAEAEDSFIVKGEKLSDYSFLETPSSPQFFIYSLASPENAVLWHGIGAYAAPKLLRSYTALRNLCRKGQLVKQLPEKLGVQIDEPLQLNLVPENMWVHPTHRNIDSSIGCLEDLNDVARKGMKIEQVLTM